MKSDGAVSRGIERQLRQRYVFVRLNKLREEIIEKIDADESIGFIDTEYKQKSVKLGKYFRPNTTEFEFNPTADEIVIHFKERIDSIDFLKRI